MNRALLVVKSFRWPNLRIIRFSEGKKQGTEKYWKKMMSSENIGQKISKFCENYNPHIQEVQQILSIRNTKKRNQKNHNQIP